MKGPRDEGGRAMKGAAMLAAGAVAAWLVGCGAPASDPAARADASSGQVRSQASQGQAPEAGPPPSAGEASPDEAAQIENRAGDRAAAKRAAAAGLGAGSSAGKPVAPIAIDHAILGAPAVGRVLEIRITVRPQGTMTDLRLQAAGGDALQVEAADAVQRTASAAADAPAVWTVRVVPLATGVAQLKLTADGVIDGRRQARSIVVPIRTGAAAKTPAAAGTPKETAPAGQAGDGVIHLHSSP